MLIVPERAKVWCAASKMATCELLRVIPVFPRWCKWATFILPFLLLFVHMLSLCDSGCTVAFVEPDASWKSHRVHYWAQQRRMRRGFQSKIDPTQTVEVIYRIAMDNDRVQVPSGQGDKLQALTVCVYFKLKFCGIISEMGFKSLKLQPARVWN